MTIDFSVAPVFAAPKTSEGGIWDMPVYAAPKTYEGGLWDWEWEGLVDGRMPRCPNRGEVTAAAGGNYRNRGEVSPAHGGAAGGCYVNRGEVNTAYGAVGGCNRNHGEVGATYGAAGGYYMREACRPATPGGGGWSNEATAHESVYKDILDMLPSDPFGMQLGSTWSATIAGWIEDLKDLSAEYHQQPHDYSYKKKEVDAEYGLVAGINFLCNNTPWLSFDSREQRGKSGSCAPAAESRPFEMSGLLNLAGDVFMPSTWIQNPVPTCHQDDAREQSAPCCYDPVSVSDTVHDAPQTATSTGHFSDFDDDRPSSLAPVSSVARDAQTAETTVGCSSNSVDDGRPCVEEGHPPHDAFVLALKCLEVQDLLSVERVCKGLRSAVRDDPLLWMCIHVKCRPLNERLTDEALIRLSQRAGGRLQCLNLVQCPKITNDGLSLVLASNPYITKLSVPDCRLNIEGLIASLKLFKAPAAPGIRNLRISGLYGVTQAHYDELKQILGMDGHQQHPKARKPRFYRAGSLPSCDYDNALDVEECPICQKMRIVYDCPSESCKGKNSEPCRGCNICITRCGYCGRCLNDKEYEENFYLDCFCKDCLDQLREAPAEGEGDWPSP